MAGCSTGIRFGASLFQGHIYCFSSIVEKSSWIMAFDQIQTGALKMIALASKIINFFAGKTGKTSASPKSKVSRIFKFKYSCFMDLLASNAELLDIITDIEEKLRGQHTFGMSYVRSQATRAVFHTLRMVKSLDDLSYHNYPMLFSVLDDINIKINEEISKKKELPATDYILPYSEIGKDMADWVGGKNANLGELKNKVSIPAPEGFAITTRACDFLLGSNELIDEINRLRMNLNIDDPNAVQLVSKEIQGLIVNAHVPAELQDAVMNAYKEMWEKISIRNNDPEPPHVALRSSAIGEDSELSYAGQYLSILNVPQEEICETYKKIVASLYTPRAISYRLHKGMRDEDISMSVACIEMVSSMASGVMYSRHPYNLISNDVLINAVWGLGPYAVDGIVTPDTYVVAKSPDLKILEENISRKPVRLVSKKESGLVEETVEDEKQNAPCLNPDQIKLLASYAVRLEDHYKYPQDIEWALAPDGTLLILQARPLHVEDMIQKSGTSSFPVVDGYELLLEGGAAAFPGVGFGPAFHVDGEDDLLGFPEGAVLFASHSAPEFVMVMRKTSAIITDAGSVTGHMASLAREFGVPTILGLENATSKIEPGTEVTVDGYSCRVYRGRVDELLAIQRSKESGMKDTPVYQSLRTIADMIVPLHLVNPKAANFRPEYCSTLHDIMRLAHELSYVEMFKISDIVSDTNGAGAKKLSAPIPLDLHIIDLGGGFESVSDRVSFVRVDQIVSTPLKWLLKGMLRPDLRQNGAKPVDLGGFFSVMREQMFAPNNLADRFGDRSYAIISDKYLNFSSRIGYHYSVLDSYCGESTNKNYITFSFKGGAADDIRRNRRARCIAIIFSKLGFQVETREDRVDARYYKYEQDAIMAKLDLIGRLLQFTRQMDMIMLSEASVETIAKSFLEEKYHISPDMLKNMSAGGNS